MSGCTSAIRNRWARTGIDLDDLFAYNTAKIVRVKDRRLGLLRLLLVGAIFGYIVIYVVIIKQAYLQFETPVGTVALSLQKPDVETRVDQLPYCSQYTGVLKPNNSTARVYDPRLCIHWDATQALYPADQRDSMFITTRVSVSIETYNTNCSASPIAPAPANSSCRTPWISSPATPYYIAGIDDFTLRVAHSMQARLFYEETGNSEYAGSSDDMKGWLVDQEGNDLRAFVPGGSNFISLYEMLNATINKQARAKGDIADLSLQSDDPVGARVGESERSAGVLLFCTIVYSHKQAGKRPNYNMHVARIPGAAYKILETQRINDTARIVFNRHGVKIVFIMTGNIGRFDFQTLLIQLVSAFALLSVATLIVENAMLYVMPEKKMYKEYKFEETADFGDIRQERRRKIHADGTITETKVQIDQNGNETVLESMDFKNQAEMMQHEAELAQSGEIQAPLADGGVTSSPQPHHRGHPHATPLMTAQNVDDAPTTTPTPAEYEARPSQVELPPVMFHPLPPRGSDSDAQRLA